MVPGRRDRRSTPVTVRRTCGAESELEEGKIGRVQTQNMKKKTIIDTRVRVQTSTSSTAEFEAPPAECSMHAPAHAVTLDRSCSACSALPRQHTGLSEGFFVQLKDGVASHQHDQVSSDSTTKLTSDKNMFGEGRRRSPQACVRQGRCQKTPTLTLLVEVLTVSPAWRFFFLWKQCTFNYCLKSKH